MSSAALIDQMMSRGWVSYPDTAAHRLLKETVLTVAGVLAIAILAQVAMPLPFTPVPMTGQTLAVLLIGASYGSRRAFRTTAAYIGAGALGMPFFANATSGMGAVLGATGGYLIGFLVAAYLMGFIADRGYFQRVKSAVPLFLLGHACIFICGMAVLGVFVGYDQVLALGFLPFIPGLIIKTVAAGVILPSLHRLVAND